MVTLTISLEDKLAQALQSKSAQAAISPEELIKQLLQKYFVDELDKPQTDILVGMFDIMEDDLSIRSEEILENQIQPHSGWTNK